jgi:hypothetical protein
MPQRKTLAEWMADKGIGLAALVAATALDGTVVQAIAECRYTPSPEQRRRLCAALGVGVDEVVWGHRALVAHIYGHVPQSS